MFEKTRWNTYLPTSGPTLDGPFGEILTPTGTIISPTVVVDGPTIIISHNGDTILSANILSETFKSAFLDVLRQHGCRL